MVVVTFIALTLFAKCRVLIVSSKVNWVGEHCARSITREDGCENVGFSRAVKFEVR